MVFRNKKYLLLFLVLTAFFGSLFIAVPTFTIVGNDLAFQLSTYNMIDYFLLGFISLLSGLVLTLQIYKWKNRKEACSISSSFVQSAGAGISGVFASLLGTAVCASCIAPIIVFLGLGFGGVLFMLKYQVYLSFMAIMLMVLILYFTVKNIDYTYETR